MTSEAGGTNWSRLDTAAYSAIAATPTPRLDGIPPVPVGAFSFRYRLRGRNRDGTGVAAPLSVAAAVVAFPGCTPACTTPGT